MTSLANIIESIKSEIKVDSQGRGFASIRATARLAGVDFGTLATHLKCGENPSKLYTLLVQKGFQELEGVGLFENGIPDIAIAAILEYYALHAGKRCTEQARLVLSTFAAVGIRAWVQDVTGYTQAVPAKHLTACDRADKLIGIKDTLVAFDIDLSNPRFKQELQDFALDIIGIGQKSLPGQQEIWLGVAERAEQLGYSINVVTKNRSQLGKYVATFDLERKQELRLCNGTQRPINLYKLTDDLDEAIKEFMDAKVLSA
jgi:hypothetical protein